MQNVVAFTGSSNSGGFLVVSLKPKGQQKGGAPQVVQRLRPKLARVVGAALFLNPAQDVRVGGRQSNATYQYTLKADNLADLRSWAAKLAEAMKSQPALTDVNTDQEDHGLETYVTVDRDKAAALSLTSNQIDQTLYDGFGEREVSTIFKETNQYHVIMEVDPRFSQDPTLLQDVYISNGTAAVTSLTTSASTSVTGAATTGAATTAASATTSSTTTGTANTGQALQISGQPGASTPVGSTVAVGATAVAGPQAPTTAGASQGVAVSGTTEAIIPLGAVAHWADQATPTSVNHQDAQPATTISYNLAPGKSLSDATKAIEQAQAQIGMPASIHGSAQGTAAVFQQSLANEPILILAALVAIYLVLGILYESYIHPLTVLSTLPSAGIGALIALILFHIEFDIIGLIGIILLIGIVKKNAILMIDFALVAEREQGLSSHDAIRQAALTRFRPIMMTTFAAILGAVPLAIGWGNGAELRRPLGVTIIGGLLVSQVITLLTTPVVYLYLDRFRRRPREGGERRRRAGAPDPQPAPAA